MVYGITYLFVKNYMKKCLKNLLEMQGLTDIISCVLFMLIKKKNPLVHDDESRGGGYPITLN